MEGNPRYSIRMLLRNTVKLGTLIVYWVEADAWLCAVEEEEEEEYFPSLPKYSV